MATSAENNALGALSTQLADAVERVGPALLLVNGRRRQPGSGVLFAEDLVLTADHILEREEDLSVQTHDQRTLPAQLVGRDPSSDLAVLRVADLGLRPAITAPDLARVGQIVLAVGRPSPDGPMASLGIVSAVGGPLRTGRGATLERYIRTDAIPYPGFSGGPLIGAEGEVLGILTTGLVGGVALAVPTPNALQIAEALAQQGYIKRGYLGISSQPVHLPETQRGGRDQETGLLILHIEEGTPAEQGGLILGDIVVGLDGQPVIDTADLQELMTGDRVGRAVPIDVIRGGTLQSVQVTIGQRGDEQRRHRHHRSR
ncbi:MAG: trypsin-like peptidase domain-containing protein [Ardenticatenales bacterium]|nr:trypsin-like peptidase domain-containing protein [Ardenticatenales bacterium]